MSDGPFMQVVVGDRRAAHAAASAAYQLVRELLESGQLRQVQLTISEPEAPWDVPLLKFYWGHVLGPISEQVRVEGQRYLPAIWHEHMKETLLGMEFVREGSRLVRRACSTTRMPPAARRDYVEHVMAYAASEFGVEFPVKPDHLGDGPIPRCRRHA